MSFHRLLRKHPFGLPHAVAERQRRTKHGRLMTHPDDKLYVT